MFVRDARSFYLLRILLGIAEAGFFPGIILYMSYWFPERERARAVAWFMLASPLSGVINGPISGALLEYTEGAWGLAGWQWIFLVEGIPAVVLGSSPGVPDGSAGRMPDGWSRTSVPGSASTDRPRRAGPGGRHGLEPPRVRWGIRRMGLLILLYFTIAMGTNGYGFFAPTIIDRHFPGSGPPRDRLSVCDPEPRRGDRHDPRRAGIPTGPASVDGTWRAPPCWPRWAGRWARPSNRPGSSCWR